MEGAGDVEAPGAGADLVARDVLGLDERVDGPAEHELAGGVVVGHHEAQARGQGAHALRVAAEHRDHAARVELAGVGHRGRALVDEPDGVVELQRAGGDQRRVLAERVPGGGARLVLVLGLLAPLVPGGDRAQEERGLLVARALGQALEGVVAEQLEAALEERVAAVGLVHSLRVAPLSGEEQCAGWHRAISPQGAHAVATVRHTAVMCQMAELR